MNYTTNYHLPQWVESDRILMEDFNQAMADIDEGLSETYTTQRKPAELKQITVAASHAAGTVLLTLDYMPTFAILSNYYGTEVLNSGSVGKLYFSSLSTTANTIQFQLIGNQLKLHSRGDNTTSQVNYFTIVLFR